LYYELKKETRALHIIGRCRYIGIAVIEQTNFKIVNACTSNGFIFKIRVVAVVVATAPARY
jgi:hypothetical protein